MLRVKTWIGVTCTLHLHTEQNAMGDNFNVKAAKKLYGSPVVSYNSGSYCARNIKSVPATL